MFLRKHLLHWLEALSLINAIAEAISYIGVLQSLTPVSDASGGILKRMSTLIYETGTRFGSFVSIS
jgi:hypothetical protein